MKNKNEDALWDCLHLLAGVLREKKEALKNIETNKNALENKTYYSIAKKQEEILTNRIKKLL